MLSYRGYTGVDKGKSGFQDQILQFFFIVGTQTPYIKTHVEHVYTFIRGVIIIYSTDLYIISGIFLPLLYCIIRLASIVEYTTRRRRLVAVVLGMAIGVEAGRVGS